MTCGSAGGRPVLRRVLSEDLTYKLKPKHRQEESHIKSHRNHAAGSGKDRAMAPRWDKSERTDGRSWAFAYAFDFTVSVSALGLQGLCPTA